MKNIVLVAIISILIGLTFSSCETDYRWERATLVYNSYDWKPAPTTNSRGMVTIEQTIDILDLGTRARDIEAINLMDSYFLMYSKSFVSTDRVSVILSTDRIRGQGFRLIPGERWEFVIDVNDYNYAAFVEELFYEIERYGVTTLYIDVETNVGGVPVDFEFFNNLDIRVAR